MSDPCFAVPFVYVPEKMTVILDKVCDHRPWFPDDLWDDPVVRRKAAARKIVEWGMDGMIWEAWRGDELLGILGADRLTKYEGTCHFVFFDRKLSDKVDLCRGLMGWCFGHLGLRMLRIEIPTYARVLARFARRKLGFRWEVDGSRVFTRAPNVGPFNEAEAELASRKYQVTLYEGRWHDHLLLSLTKEEFDGPIRKSLEREHGSPGSVAGADDGFPDEHSTGGTG